MFTLQHTADVSSYVYLILLSHECYILTRREIYCSSIDSYVGQLSEVKIGPFPFMLISSLYLLPDWECVYWTEKCFFLH